MKKVLKTLVVLIMLMGILTPMTSFAVSETEESLAIVYTDTNTDVYNLGENVQTTVSWKVHQGNMTNTGNIQAIGFTLQYDESKLEFVGGEVKEWNEEGKGTSRPLEEDYYNIETPGTIDVSVASFNNLDIYGININFKTTATGETSIKLTDVNCMANENLESPDKIDFTTNSLAKINTIAFGDVDLNGTVDIGDTSTLMQYLENSRELTEQQLINADVNLDKIVDDIDVFLIRKYLAKAIALPIRYGDVYLLDGRVGNGDVSALMQYILGERELTEQQLINADVNLDGLINGNDCALITNYLVGKAEIPTKMIISKDIKTHNLENISYDNFIQSVNGFDVSKSGLTKSELVKKFYDVDMLIKVFDKNDKELINDNDIIGTGSIVRMYYPQTGELLQEYTVVIYGDTTGDGKITAVDALAVIKDINNKIPFSSEVYREAGKVVSSSESNLSAIDALAIIKSINGKYEINQGK